MKLKGFHFADVAEIQVVVTDELKKVQKEEFWYLSETVWLGKSLYIYANGANLEFKKKVRVFNF